MIYLVIRVWAVSPLANEPPGLVRTQHLPQNENRLLTRLDDSWSSTSSVRLHPVCTSGLRLIFLFFPGVQSSSPVTRRLMVVINA